MPGREGTPFGFVQLFELVRAQVAAVGFLDGLVAPLGIEIDDIPVDITFAQVEAVLFEEIVEGRFGEAALDGDQHGLVILVAVVVEHDQDLVQKGKDEERAPADQVRVLHGDVRRQERFGDRAAVVHGIQAQAPGEVADEIDAVADEFAGRGAGGRRGRIRYEVAWAVLSMRKDFKHECAGTGGHQGHNG